MSKWFNRFVLLYLCGISYAAGAASETSEELTYYVIKDQAEPFQIAVAKDGRRGIVSDLVFEILANKELIANTEVLPFKRMLRKMEANDEKQWVAVGSPLWGGIQSKNLSISPIYTGSHKAIVSSQSPLYEINLGNLKDKHAILLFGFDYPGLDDYLSKGMIHQHRVKSHQAIFKTLDRDPLNQFSVDISIRLNHYLKKLPLNPKDYRILDFSEVIPDYSIHFAFSEGIDPKLRKIFDDCLNKLRGNGRLNQIIDRYR